MNVRRIACLALVACLALNLRGGAEGEAAPSGYVNFSFDQADVRLLVRLVGERTGRKFVVDDEVSGKVTVVTPGAIPAADVYPLLLSVLESSGYSVIEREDAAYVVPLPKGGLTGAPVVTDENAGRSHGVITRVFRISHVSAVELKRLLEPLIRGGKEGAVAAFGSTNHLLITDTEENIRQAEKIIRELDQPGSARMVEVVALKYASAVELAQQLVAAISGSESAGARVSRHLQQVGEGAASLPSGLIVVPATQANSIVVVGARVEIDEAKRIIALMDVEAPSGYGRLNAIFLRYLTAEDAAKTLNALLAKKVDKDQRQPIAIEPNAANNALVVDATPQDFAIVKKLVDELDQVPQQVMVEVLIAEVSLNKNLDLGVDLASIEIPDDEGAVGVVGRSRPGPSDTLMEAIEQGIFPQGLALGVAKGTYVNAAGQVVPRIPILIRALAQNRDVNILSSIPLWAQNNTEASVSIVENIPILRSTIEGGSGTARDVIQNIDRVDVGIKLKFTPHVNPNNEVLMQLNPSIEAILDEGPEGTQFAPTIAKREVSTTVTVPDKATIIISGLMRQDSVSELSKVPFLGDLPVIGWLFQSRRNRSQKTNLLIFVTPHIVTDMNRAIEMKQSLEKKTGINPVFETMEKQK